MAKGGCREGDLHVNPADSCGCDSDPHFVVGPAVTGSPDTSANGAAVLRGDGMDIGTHCCCCGPNVWGTLECSIDVYVNGHGWVRGGDVNWCCGGMGFMATESSDVRVN